MKRPNFQSLLTPITDQYRKRSYEFWHERLNGEPITFELVSDGGVECQVEISAFWDSKPNADIRVMFAIDDGWNACFPFAEDFIIAPDGTFVGE